MLRCGKDGTIISCTGDWIAYIFLGEEASAAKKDCLPDKLLKSDDGSLLGIFMPVRYRKCFLLVTLSFRE